MRKMLNKLLKKYAKNEKGLTLIELLVVIVILGIIAAIAVVSIGGIINNTKEKAKVTEAVQIINAAKLSHSTDGLTSWTSTEAAPGLTKYVNNVKDKIWTVTFDGTDYIIKNHNSDTVVGATAGADVKESELTDYLSGN